MPNVIALVTKYLPLLDEQYKLQSKSALLDTPKEFVRETKQAKKFKVARISTDGLANYSRDSGFVAGSATLTWDEYEYTVDRGRSFQIDDMDNAESLGLAFGRLSGTFQREHVIPEMDAYRFAKYYKAVSAPTGVSDLAAANVLQHIDSLTTEMDDAEVPESGRIIFCNPTVYNMITEDTSVTKFLGVSEGYSKALNRKVYEYNGMPIIKVPSSRFYEGIKLQDGTSGGQQAGGYVKESDETKVILLMIIQKNSVIQVSKRLISRYWAPTREALARDGGDGVNPNADAWKFDFRVYHDCWVLHNKKAGIAALHDTSI